MEVPVYRMALMLIRVRSFLVKLYVLRLRIRTLRRRRGIMSRVYGLRPKRVIKYKPIPAEGSDVYMEEVREEGGEREEVGVPELRTPTPELRTPSPELRTPSPELRTPSPELRTPTPELRTPSPVTVMD